MRLTRLVGIENEFILRNWDTIRCDSSDIIMNMVISSDIPYHQKSTTAFRLGTGGAIYSDGWELEVTTPPIEVVKGFSKDAVQSLVRQRNTVLELIDGYNKKKEDSYFLEGFSSHYNFSYDSYKREHHGGQDNLCWVIAKTLSVPLILLLENSRSSGLMFRDKDEGRIEICGEYIVNPLQIEAALDFMLGSINAIKRINMEKSCEDTLASLPLQIPDKMINIPTVYTASFSNGICHNHRNTIIEMLDSKGKIHSISAQEILEEYYNLFIDNIKEYAEDDSIANLESFVKGTSRLEIETDGWPKGYGIITMTPNSNRPEQKLTIAYSKASGGYTESEDRSLRTTSMEWDEIMFRARNKKGFDEMPFIIKREDLAAFYDLYENDQELLKELYYTYHDSPLFNLSLCYHSGADMNERVNLEAMELLNKNDYCDLSALLDSEEFGEFIDQNLLSKSIYSELEYMLVQSDKSYTIETLENPTIKSFLTEQKIMGCFSRAIDSLLSKGWINSTERAYNILKDERLSGYIEDKTKVRIIERNLMQNLCWLDIEGFNQIKRDNAQYLSIESVERVITECINEKVNNELCDKALELLVRFNFHDAYLNTMKRSYSDENLKLKAYHTLETLITNFRPFIDLTIKTDDWITLCDRFSSRLRLDKNAIGKIATKGLKSMIHISGKMGCERYSGIVLDSLKNPKWQKYLSADDKSKILLKTFEKDIKHRPRSVIYEVILNKQEFREMLGEDELEYCTRMMFESSVQTPIEPYTIKKLLGLPEHKRFLPDIYIEEIMGKNAEKVIDNEDFHRSIRYVESDELRPFLSEENIRTILNGFIERNSEPRTSLNTFHRLQKLLHYSDENNLKLLATNILEDNLWDIRRIFVPLDNEHLRPHVNDEMLKGYTAKCIDDLISRSCSDELNIMINDKRAKEYVPESRMPDCLSAILEQELCKGNDCSDILSNKNFRKHVSKDIMQRSIEKAAYYNLQINMTDRTLMILENEEFRTAGYISQEMQILHEELLENNKK